MKQISNQELSSEINVLGSRFIGTLFYLSEESQLREQVRRAWKIHPRASHICTAFRLNNNGLIISGSNDDGEPHGTAGRPMLEVLKNEEIVNVAVFVVRYFGGTKLGKGGLARAYVQSLKALLSLADVQEIVSRETFQVICPYATWERFRSGLAIFDCEIANHSYSELVKAKLKIPSGDVSAFREYAGQFIGAGLVLTALYE